MKPNTRKITSRTIVTVGLAPCWDILCYADGLKWGDHKQINNQFMRPAGSPLNVSRALAWMGQKSLAAGLWGRADYAEMLKAMEPLKQYLKTDFTPVSGRTRCNVTVVDRLKGREMHLRAPSHLVSKRSLRQLQKDLSDCVSRSSICLFAGSMGSEEYLPQILALLKTCRDRGAKLALDTSGPMLNSLIELGGIWLVKPNVDELRDVLAERIPDTPVGLIKATQQLLPHIHNLLISRGSKGALLVTEKSAWYGRGPACKKTEHSTVGCGDYLLAGFLHGFTSKKNMRSALHTALKAAAAKAWGLTDDVSWPQARRQIKVNVTQM